MRKEQVLLLALLAALFGPASSQDHFEDDEISDECILKTSIVLKQLSTCDSQKIQDDFRRNQLWTNVVKETIDEMMRHLREDIKSKSDQATEKLEKKLEGVMKQAHDDKLEMKASMDRTLLSVEANKKQMEDLLQGHDKVKSTMDRILQSDETKKKQMDDLLQGHDKMKTTMDRTLQSVEENKKQMEDLMMESIYGCQRFKASWPLIERNASMFFKTMGKTFYYNRTQYVTWYENRDWCSSRGMQMATLKTAEELKQVANTLESKTTWATRFWVSASAIGRSPAGQFQWPDGTPVHKSIHTGYEKLYDWACSDKYYTLCEVPELLATCL